MLSQEQIKQVEHSFKHGDFLVFQIVGKGVFVTDRVYKHRKNAPIEFKQCQEVDESCFEGDEYSGDLLPKEMTFILNDPYAGNAHTIASVYYSDDIKEVI